MSMIWAPMRSDGGEQAHCGCRGVGSKDQQVDGTPDQVDHGANFSVNSGIRWAEVVSDHKLVVSSFQIVFENERIWAASMKGPELYDRWGLPRRLRRLAMTMFMCCCVRLI
jgi:hypothetical protein